MQFPLLEQSPGQVFGTFPHRPSAPVLVASVALLETQLPNMQNDDVLPIVQESPTAIMTGSALK